MDQHCLFFIGLLLSTIIVDSDAASKPLYLLTIFPYPSATLSESEQLSWDEGLNILPAAYLAVDMINDRDDILRGYTLELINSDGGCERENTARVSFVKNIIAARGQMPVVGIVGPGCSSSTLAISPHSSHSDIALLNLHLAGTPLVEDRSKFTYSIGLLGSSYGFVNATVALMRVSGWKRIAVLYDEERTFFRSTYQALENDLQNYIPHAKLAFTSAVYDTYFPVADIVALDIRIIIILTRDEFARKIMCLASHGQAIYPRYQWVIMGRSVSEFNESVSFNYFSNIYNCSSERLQNSLIGSLFVNYELKRDDDTITKSNLTYDQYWELYNKKIDLFNNGGYNYLVPGEPSTKATTNRYATLVFDAVWTIALAMSKVAHFVNLTDYGLKLGQTEESNTIREIIYTHTFEGISGTININEDNGYTLRKMEILQMQENNITIMGNIEDQTLEQLILVPGEFENEGVKIVNTSVAALLSLITIVIVLITIVAHILTLFYRDHPSVKALSPKLNQISFAGFYLFSIGTLLHIIYKAIHMEPSIYGIICQVIWPWCFSISFSIFFAPICMRTWRLYRIFTHYLNPGPLISEAVLFSGVGILVGIDVVVAIIWTAVDRFQGVEIKGDIDENGDFSLRLGCYCQYTIIWYSIIYLLKMTLLLGTVIVSLLTRKINNQKFKTSFLRVFVYLFALIWTKGLLLYYFLSYQGLNIHIDYTILAIMCIILLFFSFLFVFLPPILPPLKETLYPTLKSVKSQHFQFSRNFELHSLKNLSSL